MCLSAVDIDSVVGVGLKWIKQTRTSSFFWSFCPTAMAKEAKEGAMFQLETWIKEFLEKNHACYVWICVISMGFERLIMGVFGCVQLLPTKHISVDNLDYP